VSPGTHVESTVPHLPGFPGYQERGAGVPPIKDTKESLVSTNPTAANQQIADTAKENEAAIAAELARILAASKGDGKNGVPSTGNQDTTLLGRFIESIFGDKGIFNSAELARFAIVAAGGMLTGGSVKGSLKYAGIDTLKQSDARHVQEVKTKAEYAKNERELIEKIDADFSKMIGSDLSQENREALFKKYSEAKTSGERKSVVLAGNMAIGWKANIETVQNWLDKTSKNFESISKHYFGNPVDSSGAPRAGYKEQMTSEQAARDVQSWATKQGFKVLDAQSLTEIHSISDEAFKDYMQDVKRGVVAAKLTPYLEANYIKIRAKTPDLFKLDGGKQMSPDKLISIRDAAIRLGHKEEAKWTGEIQRLAKVWTENSTNVQRKYKDSASESAFYMFVKDTLNSAEAKAKAAEKK
jgi:hypothetical protein